MPPGLIVEHQSVADALFGLGHTIIGFEIDLLMFQSGPETLDKHIFHPASLAIHADLDVMVFEYIREILAIVRDIGITFSVNNIIGFPDEARALDFDKFV